MSTFYTNESHSSQIPAIQLLVNLGYKYLSRDEALKQRQSRKSNVLLEAILNQKLKEINSIQYKGNNYLFSEENIQTAVQKLKNIKYDGLIRTNEAIYDLITLGTALEQVIEGYTKSFTLRYIDWERPERNAFHVTAEFSVERNRSDESTRPDLVLFVNGIPFCIIECKAPGTELEQAIEQTIRNQGEDYIPKLFTYAQLVLAANKNAVKYATIGTPAKFWSTWKETALTEGSGELKNLEACINSPLKKETKIKLKQDFKLSDNYFDNNRLVTEQDKSLYALCRPERLLELSWKYTLFDEGLKKIARYQQYFVVKSILTRIKQYDENGIRKGGLVWHTQGSGKSLTMVLLTRSLALDPDFINPRIILVTDRVDLDKQLGNTFIACGLDAVRATSGRNLLELITTKKAGIISTIINKFDTAYKTKKYHDESSDIFMLVDESHRTQYDSLAAKMRLMFPKACYIGFTGTPLLKKERNSFARFGKLFEPYYTIKQAVDDGAVVPLLYEGRHVEMLQNRETIDLWFEGQTVGLSEEEKSDLKRKYARAEMLNKTEQVIYTRSFDISEHFRANWQNSTFKAQLVAPGKEYALKYKKYLDEIGFVTAEVVISPPDMREGYEEVDDEPTDAVVRFWNKMMNRFGSEEEYNKQLINQFKHGTEPEILIVVDKLLTGFDAPKNTVLYLCKKLKEHTLLQAIARVNRIYEGKDFGLIVDYENILGELDRALTAYGSLSGYNEEDLEGTITSIHKQISTLPQLYSELWDIFKTVKDSYDTEAYEQLLGDIQVREDFYARLNSYAKVLALALSSEKFLWETDAELIDRYKKDLRKFFDLKANVMLRYAESVNFKRDFEPRVRKLLDTHLQAYEVTKLNDPVNIFDEAAVSKLMDEGSSYRADNIGAKADTIAHATKKVITENMQSDPYFFSKFSVLIQQAIDDYRQKRITDLEYLEKVKNFRNSVVSQKREDVPEVLRDNEDAVPLFGILKSNLESKNSNITELESVLAGTAIKLDSILKRNRKVDFWDDEDAQKKVVNEIDDYFFDELINKHKLSLEIEDIDNLIESILKISRFRDHKTL